MALSVVLATSLATHILTALLPRSSMGLSIKERAGNGRYIYDYQQHGQDWSAGQCGSRERQSPIDFGTLAPWTCQASTRAPSACSGAFYYDYDRVTEGFTLTSNGRELAADLTGMGFGGITVDNEWFDIKLVSIHTGSEHTFHGQRLPLELQLVHASSDTERLVIVAVPFREVLGEAGVSNGTDEALSGLFAGFPLPAAGQSSRQVHVVRPEDIFGPLVSGGSFFAYGGSLTVPPCTAQATWLVRRDPLTAPSRLVEIARAAVSQSNSGAENWRAPMPLMGRHVSVMFAERGHPPLAPHDEPVDPPSGVVDPPSGVAEFRGVTVAREAAAMARRTTEISDQIANNAEAVVLAIPPTG